ncbi:ABC transporter substrate-binding protein [Falsirhodobacter algicola]|uniref:ABC transporter substrate-binding protein n=1 Tax=Falsirhodobacter algicola TaxID=2692330 RepID=A0A8J8MS47_9RHOB|nr:ABC transporter substrate-binding protein [Falsirhodobacter algicola]QUS35715.1 ABC transporter substrate-binding protein [Falsirhodobacter algicola]
MKYAAFALALLPTAALADPITFAWSPNVQTPQVDMALANDYFTEAGLDVQLVPFASGREAFEALLGGQVDIAFMAEFPAATGALTGQDFAIVADLSRYTGSRIIGNAPIASAADLAGKRIGTTLGTNVDYFLSTVLKDAGIQAEVINAAPGDLVPALVRGDVDAIVPFPTFYAGAADALGDHYSELRPGGYAPHYVLSATPEMTDARAEELTAFLGALVKADADVAADPAKAAAIVSDNLEGNVTAQSLQAMWTDMEFGTILAPDLLDLLVDEGTWIAAQGVVKADAPTASTIAPYLIEAPLAAVAPTAVTLD